MVLCGATCVCGVSLVGSHLSWSCYIREHIISAHQAAVVELDEHFGFFQQLAPLRAGGARSIVGVPIVFEHELVLATAAFASLVRHFLEKMGINNTNNM